MREDLEYTINIKFNKKKAEIDFKNEPNASQIAHGIALLILVLDNRVEGEIKDTFSGIVEAVNNIQNK